MSITIPDFPLPFEIPQMIHPLIVHFAIALPAVLIILELINLVAKRRLLGGINLFFSLLIAFIFFAAYLTGKTDAKGVNVDLEALTLHKELGIYLVYGSVALLFFKLLSFINKIQFKVLFLVTLIIFTIVSFVEGKRGGELVYKYGLNVKKSQQATARSKDKAKEPKTEETSQEKAHQEEKEKIIKPNIENKSEAKKDEKAGSSESVKEQKEESQSEANTTENKQEIEKTSAEHKANSVKNEENTSKNEESAKSQAENEENLSKESNTQENKENNESQSETNSSH